MKKFYFLLLIAFTFSNGAFSQMDNSFQNGFSEGYQKALNDGGILGSYLEYADSRKCDSRNTYINDKNAKEKIYADGYRCGVLQGSNAIQKIRGNANSRIADNDHTTIEGLQKSIDELVQKKTNGGFSPQITQALNSQISSLEQ
jgi:flagellar biosynthesis/type III secretory pathway protein FliH